MAEIAGLVLGGIPIAIWALDKYAEPLETYHHYRTTISTIRTDLDLQRIQFEATLRSVGLQNPSPVEIQECLEGKFPGTHQVLIDIIKAMDERMSKLLGDLEIDINGKPRWTDDSPDRARWEWRRVKRSFASKKARSLIEDLRKWNYDLSKCLEQTEVPPEDNTRQVQALIKAFNRKHCDSVRSCLRSFHRALGCALHCNCLSSHQATVDLDWESQPLRAPWVFTCALSYETSPEEAHSWRRFRVTPGGASPPSSQPSVPPKLTPRPKSSLRLIDKLRRRSHLAPLPTAPTVVNANLPPMPTKPIANLCDEARGQCTSWPFHGCLQDPEDDKDPQFSHFSLIKHPEDTLDLTKTISLRHLLLSQNKSLALSAKHRYAIATSIAWSVLHLSDSPWLGDHWNQDGIKFFINESDQFVSRYPSTAYAFCSAASTALPSSATKDFNRLIPNKTIFTLGVILIELCLKKPLEDLRQSLDGQARGRTILDEWDVANGSLEDVYLEAGDSYGNAVQRCIKCSFQGPESTQKFNVEQFRIQFYNTVVAPVQATYLMMPDLRSNP